MAITTSICSSFKKELMQALHNLDSGGNAFKMALFIGTVAGTYGAGTTNYSNMGADELATGGGYTAGGTAMTMSGVTEPGTVARADAANVQWTAATFSTSGCLMYNTTNGNRAVAVWSFGGIQTVSSATFLIQTPAAGDSTSLLRIS